MIPLSHTFRCHRDDRKDKEGEVPGFGQLHPRSQGITTLGTIYSSSVFPNRAPKGEHLVLNFIGGATNRGILQQYQQDLVAQVSGCGAEHWCLLFATLATAQIT